MRFEGFEHLLSHFAELMPDSPALRYENKTLSFSGLYDAVKINLEQHIFPAKSIEEAKQLQAEHGGFIKTMWCGEEACELKMKEEAGMSSRCIPFEQEELAETCACCGKPAKHMIFWGVAY